MDLFQVTNITEGINKDILGLVIYNDEKNKIRFFITEEVINKSIFDLINHKVKPSELTDFHAAESDYLEYVTTEKLTVIPYYIKGLETNGPTNIIPMLF